MSIKRESKLSLAVSNARKSIKLRLICVLREEYYSDYKQPVKYMDFNSETRILLGYNWYI